MFYYAEINSEYQIINKHCLSKESDNPNYILITEDLYNNGNELGDIVGQFYNTLLNVIEIVDPYWDMGQTCWMRYKDSQMKLSTKLDNMDKTVSLKADVDHTHDGYASSDDLEMLVDVVDTKANTTHTHNNYAEVEHLHTDYALQTSLDSLVETLANEIDEKADANHSHSEYALTSHQHEEYSDVNHNHTSEYSPLSHSHDNYATTTVVTELSETVSNKANITDLNSHINDTDIHITDAERDVWNAKSNFSGNYNDLTNKPTIPSVDGLASEDYVDEKVGAVTVESIGALPNTTVIPTVPTNVSVFTNDAGYLTEHQSLSGLATETYVDTQIDAIDIPNALSDLTADSTHRLVTDAEKATWNAKSNFSGSYNDLTNKPSIPSISGLATETYVDEAVSTKANSSHTHTISNVSGLQSALDAKSDSTHNHNSSYDAKGASANALSSANAYTDTAIDTLSEVVADKANATDLTSHTGNTTVHITSTERTNWNAAKTHANSAHAPANAEPNQNAFSNVVVNGTTISADSKTDTLTFVAGSNVTITPDATGDSITISSANTVYTHPTTTGNKHIPAGGSSGQILRWASDGTAVWGSDNNTTYSNATQSASGLMSNTDKTKLDGVAENANNYTLPSAGTNLGGVKSGGDVSISSGIITVNDDSHNHVISNIDGLQNALDGKASSGHNHDGVYYTEAETDTLLEGKADTSHTHTISNITNLQSTLDGKANASHGTHVSYSTTVPVMDGAASVGTASTIARSDHKHPTDTSRAAQASLDSHTSNKSNPHGVTLTQLGVTATAAELNALDGITATVTELNYVDGVTSNIQTQLNGKAASSHGTHVSYGTTAPKANGTAAVGTATTVSRSDHVHPLQTTVSGNAGTATKLATARTISLTGDVTGSVSFDGSANASITTTVVDDSHNHIISNVDGLQTALDGKAPIFTDASGGVKYGFNASDGVNLLTQISNFGTGLHTIYSQGGVTGNPKTTESWRLIVHKTSPTIGWIMAYGSSGSVYTNYQTAANTFVGWNCIYEATNKIILWSGTAYMQSIDSNPQVITPSKPLSQCRTGWLLLWSDYDAGSGVNDSDFATTFIPKYTPDGGTWGGKAFYCDIPMYVGSDVNNINTEQRCIKPIYVHDNCIKGSYQNTLGGRNDVVLRAIYEI